MSRERRPAGDIHAKLVELKADLEEIAGRDKGEKRKHEVKFKGKIDDPPKEEGGDGGVREPIKPGPHKDLGGAALALPEFDNI